MDGQEILERMRKATSSNGKPSTNGHAKNGRPKRNDVAYYEPRGRDFWLMNERGEWTTFPQSDFKIFLRSLGVSKVVAEGEFLSDVEKTILDIQMRNDLHWAGPLAGYPAGYHEVCGARVLATCSPTLPEPKAGKWELLKTFLAELLKEQLPYLLAWLKCGRQSLAAGAPFRPGQMLALAGPAGCGKSLLQGIITEIFGGRVGKPYRYLIGKTPFNSELFSAEHMCVEDEAASVDIRSRREFGANLKNFTVNSSHSFHPKGRPAFTLAPFWRLTISCNEEPENLMVLPPLDESLRDKIMLFRCFQPTFPFTADNPKSRQEYRAKLSAELPAFLHHLKGWKIPDDMQDQRFGVKDFQHPDLLNELAELSPEWKLWTLIESCVFDFDNRCTWEGTSAELERALRLKYTAQEMDQLLRFSTACGVYLERLAKRLKTRVIRLPRKGNVFRWQILPAPGEAATDSAPPV